MKVLTPLTKESFLAGAKFYLKVCVYQYSEGKLFHWVGKDIYEIYSCREHDEYFEAIHLFMCEIVIKEIQFSDCELCEK